MFSRSRAERRDLQRQGIVDVLNRGIYRLDLRVDGVLLCQKVIGGFLSHGSVVCFGLRYCIGDFFRCVGGGRGVTSRAVFDFLRQSCSCGVAL